MRPRSRAASSSAPSWASVGCGARPSERRTPSSARMSLSESRPRRSMRAKSSSRSASAIISRTRSRAVASSWVASRVRSTAIASAAVRSRCSSSSRRAGDEVRGERRARADGYPMPAVPAHSGPTKASAARSMIGSVTERNAIAARTSARPRRDRGRPGAERVEDEQRRRDHGAAAAGAGRRHDAGGEHRGRDATAPRGARSPAASRRAWPRARRRAPAPRWPSRVPAPSARGRRRCRPSWSDPIPGRGSRRHPRW